MSTDAWYAGLTAEQEALAVAMSDASEEAWAAGWLSGCEVDLWQLIYGDRQSWGMGSRESLAPRLFTIKALAESCGSWIVYDDKAGHLTAVTFEEWRERREFDRPN